MDPMLEMDDSWIQAVLLLLMFVALVCWMWWLLRKANPKKVGWYWGRKKRKS